jgi:hypothetical protein
MSLMAGNCRLYDQSFEQAIRSVEGRQSAWDRVRSVASVVTLPIPNLKGRTGATGWVKSESVCRKSRDTVSQTVANHCLE